MVSTVDVIFTLVIQLQMALGLAGLTNRSLDRRGFSIAFGILDSTKETPAFMVVVTRLFVILLFSTDLLGVTVASFTLNSLTTLFSHRKVSGFSIFADESTGFLSFIAFGFSVLRSDQTLPGLNELGSRRGEFIHRLLETVPDSNNSEQVGEVHLESNGSFGQFVISGGYVEDSLVVVRVLEPSGHEFLSLDSELDTSTSFLTNIQTRQQISSWVTPVPNLQFTHSFFTNVLIRVRTFTTTFSVTLSQKSRFITDGRIDFCFALITILDG